MVDWYKLIDHIFIYTENITFEFTYRYESCLSYIFFSIYEKECNRCSKHLVPSSDLGDFASINFSRMNIAIFFKNSHQLWLYTIANTTICMCNIYKCVCK